MGVRGPTHQHHPRRLAEYIVAKALGIRDTKRVEWDPYDLEIDDVKVEVKSAAYVQTWEQARIFRDRVRHPPRKRLGSHFQHLYG